MMKNFLKHQFKLQSTRKFNFSYKNPNSIAPSLDEMTMAGKLCQLAEKGDIGGLQKALSQGCDLNSKDYDFRTPLHLAAASGQLEVCEWLINQKVNITLDRFGGLPIHDAIRHAHHEITELFTNNEIIDSMQQSSKKNLMDIVQKLLIDENIFSNQKVAQQLEFYFNELEFDDVYFKFFTPPQIAKHINLLIGATKIAEISGDKENLLISLHDNEQTFFLCTEQNLQKITAQIQDHIENISQYKAFDLVQMKTKNPAIQGGTQKLYMIYIRESEYENPELIDSPNIYLTSNVRFITRTNAQELKRYQTIMHKTYENPGSQMSSYIEEETGQRVFMFGVKQGRSNDTSLVHNSFLEELNKLFERNNVSMDRFNIQSFSNGIYIYTLHTNSSVTVDQINQIQTVSNIVFNTPYSKLTQYYLEGKIGGHQCTYLYAAIQFTYYFLQQKLEDYEILYKYLENDSYHLSQMKSLRQDLTSETATFDRMQNVVTKYPEVCAALFDDFQARLLKKSDENSSKITNLSKSVFDPFDQTLIKTFQIFNQSIVKTNFFRQEKSAVAYRLDPKVFLQHQKLPEIPYGIYMFIGRDFLGFHIRFRDIARGGVRIVKSLPDNYQQNKVTIFQESYGLAYTQKNKNKDIAESGSKGTILMNPSRNHMGHHAFMQYVDALSDIMLNKQGVIELDPKRELIFLGPDENTAGFMDLAAKFLKKKQFSYWKSFTTGKSPNMGGIPHDTYGMTTRSVRAYAEGIIKKLNLNPKELTKIMTGGPDGDLGSNEIKMSEEKICGIVDGSGVLYDPEGLDRNILMQLVETRRTIENYSGHFSPKGYFVGINDENKLLPDGTFVESGVQYRNTFHLNKSIKADFFIPCGGRPESINSSNVAKMFDDKGKCRFKYIVEGANLFISEAARETLEKAGVILFKDASTNKGGVTSSSFEVLAALAMEDQQFIEHMTIQNGVVPDFYQEYVKEICARVEHNATMEFEYIWQEHQKTNKTNCSITNELSQNMNNLCDLINDSDLFENQNIKNKVLKEMIPTTLQELVGFEKILATVPLEYQKAMFGAHLSAKYFYINGSKSNVYLFYDFMHKFEND